MMRTYAALPAWPLRPESGITAQFLALGLTDFRQAAAYLNQSLYGRNSYREDSRAVLQEGRGACSSKHTLLAAVDEEQDFDDVALTLGLYHMSEANTSGVGAVLAQYGLPYIPEAHCYLRFREKRMDITRSG